MSSLGIDLQNFSISNFVRGGTEDLDLSQIKAPVLSLVLLTEMTPFT
jgi:hypothetical protein